MVCRDDQSGDLIHGALVAPESWSHWLVKFRSRDDPADIGPIEQAYAEMARVAGLILPPTRLLPSGSPKTPAYFAAQRFDRVGPASRTHFHSACGHLHADFQQPSLDYKTLMILTFQLTKDHRQLRAMAAEFSIPPADVTGIIDQVRGAVDRWRDFAEDSGVGRTSRSRIGAVIAPRRTGRKP